jgi:hypothetical protein
MQPQRVKRGNKSGVWHGLKRFLTALLRAMTATAV